MNRGGTVMAESEGNAGADPASTAGRLRSRRRNRLLGVVGLLVLLVISCGLSLLLGSKTLSFDAVVQAFTHPDLGAESTVIVRELRLPRTVIGALVGASLGLAGALMQGHTRNPIADPGILGITQGAALAVVLAVFCFGITSLYGFVWFGLVGALLGVAAVFAIGSIGRGGATPVTLALAGAAISALLYGITSAIVLLDDQSLDTYRFWKVGSIAVTDVNAISQVTPLLLVGVVLGLANAQGLNALSLGDDVARSLGYRVQLSRRLGIAAIAVLVGGSVAVCGPIAFVGLVVPHVARKWAGADYRWLLPLSLLLGAVTVLLADVIGRVVASPAEVQVGVMWALIGAPFFIMLVRGKLVRL